MKNIHSHRKDEHISLAEKFYQENTSAGFKSINLRPNSLPNLSINDISLSTTLAGLDMKFPFFIQAMTGGSDYTGKLNARLAKIAKQTGLAMAVGSQSVALKNPELEETFRIVRDINPDGIVIANLSAMTNPDAADKAINMIGADILQLHINVAQELVMPEGDRSFNQLEQIKKIINQLELPIVVKSVGNGMTNQDALKLKSIGVKFIDVGGKGGTNFIEIENARRSTKDFKFLTDFGLTTVESLKSVNNLNLSVTATGGIRNAADIVKSLALGADNVGMAGFFLHQLLHHDDQFIIDLIEQMKYQLKVLMVLVGAASPQDLSEDNLY